MAETTPPNTNAMLPLEQLVKIPRGKKRVQITADLLPRIDLTQLKSTLLFDLDHYFTTNVELRVLASGKRLEVKVTISTKATEWPQPAQAFVELFYVAVATATLKSFLFTKEADFALATINGGSRPTGFEYRLEFPVTGEEVLERLRSPLSRIQQAMPAVLSVIAHGPKAGSSAPTDEHGDELEDGA